MHTGIPIDGKTVFTSDHALKLEWLPQWVAIIGSGYIGLEFSDVYTALGTEVTFIEVGVPAALCVCCVCAHVLHVCFTCGRAWTSILVPYTYFSLLAPPAASMFTFRVCAHLHIHMHARTLTCKHLHKRLNPLHGVHAPGLLDPHACHSAGLPRAPHRACAGAAAGLAGAARTPALRCFNMADDRGR